MSVSSAMIKININAMLSQSLIRDLNGRLCYSLNLTSEGLQKPGQGIGDGENVDSLKRTSGKVGTLDMLCRTALL